MPAAIVTGGKIAGISCDQPNGRYVHDMYLMQVKTPAESKKPWDYLETIATIPGDEAFTKLADSKCPLLKK